MKHSYIVELKYAKYKDPENRVEELRLEAIDQANRYADTDTVKRAVGTTQLHKIVVVYKGNGTVETVLCRHGKRKAVDKKFTFLLVTLGGVAFQAVSNITEIGFPVAIVGKSAGKFVLFVTTEIEFGFVIGT